MAKRKKALLICLSSLCLVSLSFFIGCNSSVGRKINTNEVCDEYTWNYEREFVDEHDSDMFIDGKLDEDRWTNQHYLQFTENGITMKYTTVFTSYGVYVGAKVENDVLKWNGRFNFAGFWQNTTNNSAFGFKIQGPDVVEEHATTVFNFFVDAKNAASRNQTHFEAKSITNGDVDKGTATEMTAELFVSWKALNIEIPEGSSYPEYIRIYPGYRYVEEIKSANNKWLYPLFSEYGETRLLHRSRFNADGYLNYDREDAILGDAANGICKSDGWDLSQIAEGIVSTDVYHSQAIFFKGIESDSYAYTTHIKFGYDFPGTGTGHAGVCDMINSELFNAFYIAGYSVTNGTTKLNYHTLNFFRDGESRSNWHDNNEGYYDVPEDKDPYNDGIDITVIKQKEKFFYFIYDDLVLCKGIDRIAGKTCPGLYTLSKNAIFTDYSVTDFDGREDEINALIKASAYKITAPGNISGGTITADKTALKINDGACAEDLTLNILPNSGYVLTSFNIGGTTYDEKSAYQLFLDKCNEGILVISKENIIDDIAVTAEFKQLSKFISQEEIITVSGVIKKSSTEMLSNVNVLIKNANATLCYKTTTTSSGNYRFRLPRAGAEINNFVSDGIYKIYIEGTSLGYRDYAEDFELPANQTDNKNIDITLSRLIVGGSVSLGANDLKSDINGWDYSTENEGNVCITTSKTPTAKAYFTDTVSKNHYAAVETSFENLTDFNAENYEIEPGIGFFVDTGARNLTFILTGKKVTILLNGDWNNKIQTASFNLFDTDTALTHGTYTIKLIHQNSDFTLLFKDGEEWKTIATYQDTTFNRECAYGLTVTSASQKVLLIKFFDYSINVDNEGSLVTFSDENLSVTANDIKLESGARVDDDTLVDVTYKNDSVDKSAVIYVNGKRQFVVAPNSTETFNFTAKMFFEYNITVELNEIKVIYGDGIKVYDKENGILLNSGSLLNFGTEVKIIVSDFDKTKIAKLYLNNEDTGFYVVNGICFVDYVIDRHMEFYLNIDELNVSFNAIYPVEQQYMNGREQGYDENGYLFGPNCSYYSVTPELKLDANAIFTTTLKFNTNGYMTGVRFIIGDTEYRVMGRPWFRVDGKPDGEYRSNYIALTYGPLLNGAKLNDNLGKYTLSTTVDDDQIVIKLIFDDLNDKVYVLINGEDFTETLNVEYNPSETGDFARVQLLNCCNNDGIPASFKTWSLNSGEDVLKDPFKSMIVYNEDEVSVTANGEALFSGEKISADTQIFVEYENKSLTRIATISINDYDLFVVLPGDTNYGIFVTENLKDYVICLKVTDITVTAGDGITVVNASDGASVSGVLEYGTKVKVIFANNDETKLVKLYANGQETGYYVESGELTVEYTILTATEFKLVDIKYTEHSVDMNDDWFIGYEDHWENK